MNNLLYMLAKVRIHKQTPSKKCPYILVAAMVYDIEDVNKFMEKFKWLRIDSDHIAERSMTISERDWTKHGSRIFWFNYRDWETLLSDQWKATHSIDWIKELHNISGLSKPLFDIILKY